MAYTTVVLITLGVYLAVLLGIGLWAQRRTQDGEDYWVGGRRLGPWLAAVGASASSSSAWTLLGVSGAAWAWGLSALWLFPACVGGFLLNWSVVAPAMRRFGHETGSVTLLGALLVGHTGRGREALRWLGATVILLCLGAYVASQLDAAGKTFGTLLDVDKRGAIGIGTIVILAYVMLGGFWAVSVTDTLQGLMMALTALVLPAFALAAVGGFEGLGAGLGAVTQAGFLDAAGPRAGPIAVGFVLGLLGIGLGYPGQPHVAKYFLAMDADEGVVRRARWIAIGWAVVIYAGMLIVGLCGRVLFASLADKEAILVELVRGHVPAAVGGVMLGAVLSAMMSTVDSQVLVASSTVAHDLGAARNRGLTASRLTVLVLMIAAAGVAMLDNRSIYDRVLFGWAAMGAAFGPLVLVQIVMRRRVPTRVALVAMVVGVTISVLGAELPKEAFGSTGLQPFCKNGLGFLVALALVWWGRERSTQAPRA